MAGETSDAPYRRSPRAAGLQIGDRVVAHADGAGRVVLEREHDILAEFAGTMTGAYTVNELDDLRREWD